MVLETKMCVLCFSIIFNVSHDSKEIWDFNIECTDNKIKRAYHSQIMKDLECLANDIGQDIMVYKNSESFLMKQISDLIEKHND